MAWDGKWDATYGTATSDLTAGMQTYYDKKFLQNMSYNLHMTQFASKRPLPEGGGKTIQFFGYNELSETTTALTTEGANPDPTLITGYTVNRTLREYGAYSQYSRLLSMTHIDKRLDKWSGLWGNMAGRSIDRVIMNEVVTLGCTHISADADAAACGAGQLPGQWHCTENGTTTKVATTCFTETVVSTGDLLFADTDNWYMGGQMTAISGANEGQTRYVYDSDLSENSVLVYPSWENAPTNGDEYIFSHAGKSGADAAVAHTLAATDTLTHKVFAMALENLQTYETPTYGGGYYVFLIGPTTNRGFMTDTDGGWMGLAQYRGQSMFKGEIGKYMGFRVVQTSKPFRAPQPAAAITGGVGATSATDYGAVGTNYASNGACHWSLAMGPGAYGVTMLPGYKKPKIIAHAPGSGGSMDPLSLSGTIGWYLPFTPAALNSKWCTAVVSGDSV